MIPDPFVKSIFMRTDYQKMSLLKNIKPIITYLKTGITISTFTFGGMVSIKLGVTNSDNAFQTGSTVLDGVSPY